MRPSIPGLPLLGVVPESSALSRSAKGKKDAKEALPASEAEAFHLIRAHLRYFNVDRELRTLLVASAAPGDGKTTVAPTGSEVLSTCADVAKRQSRLKLGVGCMARSIWRLSSDRNPPSSRSSPRAQNRNG